MPRYKRVLQYLAVTSTLIAPIAANCQTLATRTEACCPETVIYNFTGSNGDDFQPLGAARRRDLRLVREDSTPSME
jgi:hypothetical protein